MRAMILAAGFGSRLGEIGKTTPKCLLQVAGKSLLEYAIERLAAAGVTQAVINLHHLSARVQEYVSARSTWPLRIEFSPEASILGTGGGLKAARALLDHHEPFFVHNADIYCEFDLRKLYQEHLKTGALATLLTRPSAGTKALLFDAQQQLRGWQSPENERYPELRSVADAQALGFCGVQVVSPGFFRYMQPFQGQFSVLQPALEAAIAGEPVRSFALGGAYWKDVGTPQAVAELERYLRAGPEAG
jgi:MurNAc alpha-1-phosphate uridylyltransferase